jgi:hypothetical protein
MDHSVSAGSPAFALASTEKTYQNTVAVKEARHFF